VLVVVERARAVIAAAAAAVAAMKVVRAFSENGISVSGSNTRIAEGGKKRGWKNEKALTHRLPQRL
jgi:hypothetical protein